ncbi:MAG: hypothetical protein LBR23_00785, partial [Spirochaetaceae bacterium]|nr:hypothetical protein [Spirochaetaceae bacterium]
MKNKLIVLGIFIIFALALIGGCTDPITPSDKPDAGASDYPELTGASFEGDAAAFSIVNGRISESTPASPLKVGTGKTVTISGNLWIDGGGLEFESGSTLIVTSTGSITIENGGSLKLTSINIKNSRLDGVITVRRTGTYEEALSGWSIGALWHTTWPDEYPAFNEENDDVDMYVGDAKGKIVFEAGSTGMRNNQPLLKPGKEQADASMFKLDGSAALTMKARGYEITGGTATLYADYGVSFADTLTLGQYATLRLGNGSSATPTLAFKGPGYICPSNVSAYADKDQDETPDYMVPQNESSARLIIEKHGKLELMAGASIAVEEGAAITGGG